MLLLMTLAVATMQSPAGRVGLDAAAQTTVSGSPATFDLAGFRLGMTEAEAEHVLQQRGLTVRRRTRGKTFEDRVRDLVNLRGGRAAPKGGSVLDTAEMDDGKGGRVLIQMLAWPDGARVRGITYLAPAGTDATAWRSLLVGKYGHPSRDSGSVDEDGLHARWCGMEACLGEGGVFRLTADVGMRGGSIVLAQPDGSSRRATELLEKEVARRAHVGTPSP